MALRGVLLYFTLARSILAYSLCLGVSFKTGLAAALSIDTPVHVHMTSIKVDLIITDVVMTVPSYTSYERLCYECIRNCNSRELSNWFYAAYVNVGCAVSVKVRRYGPCKRLLLATKWLLNARASFNAAI